MYLVTDIDMPPVEKQRERAQKHLHSSLCLAFWGDFELLNYNIHPLLYEKPKETQKGTV